MRRALAGVLGLVAAVAWGCGGGAANPGPAAPAPLSGRPTASPSPAGCPAAAGLPSGANDHGAAAVSGQAAAIEANDVFFAPTCLVSVRPGTLTVTVHNAGSALHNLSVTSQNIDMDVAPGQSVTVQVQVSATPVAFFCKYHRASGMVGSLVPSGPGG